MAGERGGNLTLGGLRPGLGLPRALATRSDPYVRDAAAKQRLAAAVARYFELVWRSLRRFGVPESTVDDAVQHVLLTLSERLDDVEPGRERAFLLATAVRVAANARRWVERARETPLADVESALAGHPTPEALLEHKRRRAVLDRALASLPLEQRAVFVLYELEGFSLPEIADTLGIPLGTATSRLRRARGRFETWVESHPMTGEDTP